ncbi:hypothetical protein AKO1_013336 [Acrasis kona]|uniref:Uncharacterized protein n=1 Tax=Acrasis kona TaxID=1008807 RepID=A0AAW2YXA1_9EUKA
MKFLIILMLAASLLVVNAIWCPPGRVWIYLKRGGYCRVCDVGNFCRDGHSYPCSEGTYSPHLGASECIKCKNPSTGLKDYCLADDIPNKLVEWRQTEYFYLDVSGSTELVSRSVNNVFNIAILKQRGKEFPLSTFNVVQRGIETDLLPITLYASNTTGTPSEENHTYKAVGTNVTALFDNYQLGNKYIDYFTLVFRRPTTITYGVTFTSSPKDILTSKNNITTIDFDGGNNRVTFYRFNVPRVEKRSRITLRVAKKNRDILVGVLVWNSDKQISKYVNTINAEVVSDADETYQVDHSITVEDQGDVIIGCYLYQGLPSVLEVKVEVTALNNQVIAYP